MNNNQQKIIWQEQTEHLYLCIGKFIVKFERVCFSLSIGIMAMLDRSGLKDQQIINVLLAGITAEPLRALFESLAAQTDWLSSTEREQLKTILTRFHKLISERNDIVHGTWLIDFHNYASHQEDFSIASGMKFHKNKDGAATKSLKKTPEEFSRLIQEADALRTEIDKLCHRFIFDKKGNQVALGPYT